MKAVGGFRRTRFVGIAKTQLAAYVIGAASDKVVTGHGTDACVVSEMQPMNPSQLTDSSIPRYL